MDVKVKKLVIAVAVVITAAVVSGAMSDDASARSRKHVARVVAPPPPSWGYYGNIPVTYDNYAQAQVTSLARPYYSHFMYDYCDYRNCVLRWNGNAWVPVWYGPIN